MARKCEHEGEIRWIGSSTKGGYTKNRRLSDKRFPVLYCRKCDKDFYIKFEEEGEK